VRESTETTREHAAEWLGVSIGTVQKLEREGKIRTRKEGKRVYLRAEDVQRARLEWKPQRARRVIRNQATVNLVRGQAAVACYPCFDQGMSINDVVLRTGVDPVLVRQLYEEWGVSFEEGRARRAAEIEQRRQDRIQRQHDKEMRLREYRKWQTELARIVASGGRREDAGPEPKR
jgi:excisionase family DNA binding protein